MHQHYDAASGLFISKLSEHDLPLEAHLPFNDDIDTARAVIDMAGCVRLIEDAAGAGITEASLNEAERAALEAALAPTAEFITECGIWELVTHTSMRALELAIARGQFAAGDVDFVVSRTSRYFYARVASGGSISVSYDMADGTARTADAPRMPRVRVVATPGPDAQPETMAELGEHVALVARAIDPASTQPAF